MNFSPVLFQAAVVDAMGTAVNAPTSTATVVLTVTDVNDNPPTFSTNSYLGSVSELADIGNIAVAGVRAFDLDAVSLITQCQVVNTQSVHESVIFNQ